jgi:hypothetical protein
VVGLVDGVVPVGYQQHGAAGWWSPSARRAMVMLVDVATALGRPVVHWDLKSANTDEDRYDGGGCFHPGSGRCGARLAQPFLRVAGRHCVRAEDPPTVDSDTTIGGRTRRPVSPSRRAVGGAGGSAARTVAGGHGGQPARLPCGAGVVASSAPGDVQVAGSRCSRISRARVAHAPQMVTPGPLTSGPTVRLGWPQKEQLGWVAGRRFHQRAGRVGLTVV